MSVDMFLDLGKKIKGESIDSTHKGKIDILNYQWRLSNQASFETGKGGGTSKVDVQNIMLTKYVDLSSPDLMQACCEGTHLDEATIIVRKAGGNKALEYLKISLKNVMISECHLTANHNTDRLTETIALAFAIVKVEYTPQSDKGGKESSTHMTWNIPKHAKE